MEWMRSQAEFPGRAVRGGRVWADLLGLAGGVALLCWLGVQHVEVLRSFERWSSDFRIALFSPSELESQSPDLVILGIDEQTLSQMPYRSPIKRGFMAKLLQAVDRAGPRAIGVDLIFDQATVQEEDQALKQTLASLSSPLTVAVSDARAGLSEPQLRFQREYLTGIRTGLANLATDPDGIVRRSYAGDTVNGRWHDSLAGAIVRSLGLRAPKNSSELAFRTGDADGVAYRSYPAHLAASGHLPPQWLEKRIVLIGTNLPQDDRHRTPLRLRPGLPRTTAGVQIHAAAIDQMLQGRAFPRASTWAQGSWLIAFVLLGVLLAWIQLPLWIKSPIALAVLIVLGGVACLLFRENFSMVPFLSPGLGFLATFSIGSIYIGQRAKRSERFIRTAFGQYLSPNVIEKLVADPEGLTLRGEKRQMSFLFSDLAGFTALTERLPPGPLVETLQDYLDRMVEIALSHDGTIDKFMGDGVMVLFGAPGDQPDHAQRAVDCAIEMDRCAEKFRREQNQAGVDWGESRFGVHSGVATVGNIGGRRRFDYTAIGDAVNIASRLEGANRHLGTRVCVSAEAAARYRGVCLRPVGTLVLKGKEQGIEAFTPLDPVSESAAAQYEAAYEALKTGSSRAQELFEKLVKANPRDRLSLFHQGRLSAGKAGTRIVMEAK